MSVSVLDIWVDWFDKEKRDGWVSSLYLTILVILTRLRAQTVLSSPGAVGNECQGPQEWRPLGMREPSAS